MDRLINRWGRNYFKSKGKHVIEIPNKGIYVYANKDDNEPEQYYKNWDEVASFHIPTNVLSEISKYKKRKHHLRK